MPHANASSAHTPSAPAADIQHHPAVEEYLETIFHLEEAQVPAMRARLVERLGVSAPAVSEQIKRLEREGYVRLTGERTVTFTPEGRSYATAIVRRHRLAECLLVDVLGLPWHQVHVEAGQLEHAISPVLEERLATVLGDPVTCPHGNPIPGSKRPYSPGPMRALTDLPVGGTSTIIRLEEDLQADHEMLMTLQNAGAVPGAKVEVEARDSSVLRFRAPDGVVELSIDAAAGVRVKR